MPLGNMGDDGSGILMCARAGAELGAMDRCSAWKFTNPPFSFLSGVLINGKGERVGNEDTYGATFADFLVQSHEGKGFLVIDQEAWDEANADCLNPDSGLQEDQRMQGLANLHKNCKKADTFEELARVTGATQLPRTMQRYNADCARGVDTEFGKLGKYCKPFAAEGPYYAINLNMLGNKYWPTPCMTLGGVRVEGSTGRVLERDTLKPIDGLYAAGKSAVGIASRYYVSGLSLADAIFTGRRAGRDIAKL
jgi:3-oxo-5alpha-steroid 4-dehydrogenase